MNGTGEFFCLERFSCFLCWNESVKKGLFFWTHHNVAVTLHGIIHIIYIIEKFFNMNIKRSYSLSQINAYAMQHGLVMGVWNIATMVSLVLGLQSGLLSMLSFILLIGTPFFAYVLTKRYRKVSIDYSGLFTLTQGFMHTFLTFFYGSLWLAVFVYVYMAYLDNGFLVDSYLQYLARPEVKEAMEQAAWKEQVEPLLAGNTIENVVESFRSLPPTYYVLMCINTCLVWSPALSLFIGWLTRKNRC